MSNKSVINRTIISLQAFVLCLRKVDNKRIDDHSPICSVKKTVSNAISDLKKNKMLPVNELHALSFKQILTCSFVNLSLRIETAINIMKLMEAEALKSKNTDYVALAGYLLAYLYFQRIKGNKSKNIEIVIRKYSEILDIWTRDTYPDEWAGVKYDLGWTYCKRVAGNLSENQENAIDCFYEALKVRTKEKDPVNWAIVKHTLGIVFAERIKGQLRDNQKTAKIHYEDVLSVCTENDTPMYWANSQQVLGNLYARRVSGIKSENQESARIHYENALRVWTKSASPMNWALTKHALGLLFSERIKGDPASNLNEAILHYEDALTIYTKENAPTEWARVKFSLGNVLSDRITGDKSNNQEAALLHFKEAFHARSRKSVPLDWARAKFAVGNLYADRLKGNKSRNLEKARFNFEDALKEWTREKVPMDWGRAKYALANLYMHSLASSTKSNCENAIKLYEEVLEVWNQDNFSIYWAESQINLASLIKNFDPAKSKKLTGESLEFIFNYSSEIDPEASENNWAKYGKIFHRGLSNLVGCGCFDEAIKWIEAIKTKVLIQDINLESIECTNENAREWVEKYWGACSEIRIIRSSILSNRFHQNDEPDNEKEPYSSRKHSGFNAKGYSSAKLLDTELLKRLNREKQFALEKILEMAPDYHALIRPGNPTVPEICAALIKDNITAAVSMWISSEAGELRTFVIIKNSNNDLKIKDMAPIPWNIEIEDELSSLDIDAQLFKVSEIFSQLFKYMESLGVKKIYVSPHGIFQSIPIHAAWLYAYNNFQDNKLKISSLPSLSMGVQLSKHSETAAGKTLVVFYAPENRPLPGGQSEYSTLQSIHGSDLIALPGEKNIPVTLQNWSRILQDDSANISRISLICHGAARSDGFWLSLADGEVSHTDLMNCIRLKGIDVHLFACETGKSDNWKTGNDGYRSLSAYFHLMGAKSCISSYQKIDDLYTSEISKRIHKEIKLGRNGSTAFFDAIRSFALDSKNSVLSSQIDRGLKPTAEQAILPKRKSIPLHSWVLLKYSGIL